MTSRRNVPGRAQGMTRRGFTALGGAAALFPAAARAQTALPANPDVVIIGAGASGIAAAHALGAAGVSYALVEAAGHVGGRVVTDTQTFGVPFDLGAHWVQSQFRNPYFARAKASGGRFYKAPEAFDFYDDGRVVSEAEQERFWETLAEVEAAIGRAAKSGRDVAPSTVVPRDPPWGNTAWFYLGPWIMGKDMDDFSTTDWWNSAGTIDWFHADGFGRLVADHAAGLPVALNTPVRRVRWGGPGVEVETDKGTLSARAVIVTVSTSVLASEGLRFDPPLPLDKQESFDAIPMGHYNHIALHFSEDIFGMGPDGYIFEKVDDGMEAFGGLTNASGTGLAYCDTGGSFARELELAGKDAAIDFVLGRLRGMVGSDVDKYLTGAAATEWGNNPLVQGCYASARPGAYAMREVLRRPVGDRVFFAGEACHEDLWATVGGADHAGTDTGTAVASMILREG